MLTRSFYNFTLIAFFGAMVCACGSNPSNGCTSNCGSDDADMRPYGDGGVDSKPDMTPRPSHCTNGVQDADETHVDCGGSCAPCAICHPTNADPLCASQPNSDCQCDFTWGTTLNHACVNNGVVIDRCATLDTCKSGVSNGCVNHNLPLNCGVDCPRTCDCIAYITADDWTFGDMAGLVESWTEGGWTWTHFGGSGLYTCSGNHLYEDANATDGTAITGTFSSDCQSITFPGGSGSGWIQKHR